MNSTMLVQARHVWSALFRAGVPVKSERWVSWADTCISESADAPPAWLCSLALASTPEAASVAVSGGLGLEGATDATLDSQALVIGFVVGRHLAGQVTTEEMWAKLAEVADVAEFLDSGKWRQYAATVEASSPLSSPLQCLTPMACFAHEQAAALLQAPGA